MDYNKNINNNYNLSDIETIKDFSVFSHHFENSVKQKKIQDLLIGPNIINIKYPTKQKESSSSLHVSKNAPNNQKSSNNNNEIDSDLDENPKLINTLCQIILNTIHEKKEQTLILNSCSNFISKSYLKKLLRELDLIVEERETLRKQQQGNSMGNSGSAEEKQEKESSDFTQQLLRSILFVDFFAIFTSIKTNQNDEIPITDYVLDFYNIKGCLKFGSLTNFQLNTNFIYNRGPEVNNLNIFYMMLYNLPEKDLFDNLFCEQTQNYFGIFDPNMPLDDYMRRYLFASQFSILRNNQQFDDFAKSNNNVHLMKKEYDFYRNLYNSYLSTKDYLGIDPENEKKIFEVFYAILLISEFDPFKNPFVSSLIKRLNSERNPISASEILTYISEHLKSEENKLLISKSSSKSVNKSSKRYFFPSSTGEIVENNESNFDYNEISILKKLSTHLDLQPEKIIYLLLIENLNDKVFILSENNSNYLRARNHLIKIIFLVFIDKIESLFKLIENRELNKINIYIAHSNLVHNETFHNPYKNENKNFFVDKYIRETIIANYIQEIKNFSIMQNSLKISVLENDENFPSIKLNEKYLAGLFNQDFNFFNILELYENEEFGLLKVTKEPGLINDFKNFFTKKFSAAGQQNNSFFEIIENNFVRIKHSFGVFYYDLVELLKEIQFAKKANFVRDLYFKFIGYKINELNYEIRVVNNLDFSVLANFTNEIIYVAYLIKLGTYSLRAILDDFRLFHVYNFFSKFYVFVFDVNSLREIIRTNKKFQNLFHYLNFDDFTFFKKTFARKINISQIDFLYDKGFVLIKNSYNKMLDENKIFANFIYKYDLEMFLVLKSKKLLQPNFSRFKHIVKSVRSYLKFTKIYQEKKVFKITKNCILDLVLDNYKTTEDLDAYPEFKFDFQIESVPKLLPKLHSNLNHLKKIWKNYMEDILYLDHHKTSFQNLSGVEDTIKERLGIFQLLIFLFSKKYNFVNFEILRKNGVLHYEFTKSILADTLNSISKLFHDMKTYLVDNNFKIQNKELINMKILALKRQSVKEQYRKSLMESNLIPSEITDPNNIAYLNINSENLESLGDVDSDNKNNDNRKIDGKFNNSSSIEDSTPTKENNFSFRSINVEDNTNNNNDFNKQKKNFEINSLELAIINDAGTRVNLKMLNNKLQLQNSNSTEYSIMQQAENKRRFSNLIMGKDNIGLVASAKNTNTEAAGEEKKENLNTSNSFRDIPNPNNKRKINAQKYVNDGIINQILSIDDKKKASEFEKIPKPNKLDTEKEVKNNQKEVGRYINPENFIINIESTKLNLSSKFENEKESDNKIAKIGLYNNEELSITNQNNKSAAIDERQNSLMSHRASANLEENEDISTNNHIEYINSEGEPINKRFSVSKCRMSRAGAESPFDDSNSKNLSKFININKQNNNELNNNNNNNDNAVKNKIVKRFENKFLSQESKNSIFYNPENNKTTAYLNLNKNDFTDLNDSRNQIIFFGIKDINSKDYFVKPRVSYKKNISSFINSDTSFNNNNNSKVYTESNVSDLNVSAGNVSAFSNNLNVNNNNQRKSLRSHSNNPEFIPDYTAYAIEKSLNFLIVDKQKTEAPSGKKPESADEFKRFRNNRKSVSDLSFERENNFSLVSSQNSNVKESSSQNYNNEKQGGEMIIEKDQNDEYINLTELKNLDENLDLLKKKIGALEMWKTVNESTGKLCLGDLIADSTFSLDDTNENSEFFNEIMTQLNNAEMKIKLNSFLEI